MGTGASGKLSNEVTDWLVDVKLNNPLMGTETSIRFCEIQSIFNIVKLNNPLMGTETSLIGNTRP